MKKNLIWMVVLTTVALVSSCKSDPQQLTINKNWEAVIEWPLDTVGSTINYFPPQTFVLDIRQPEKVVYGATFSGVSSRVYLRKEERIRSVQYSDDHSAGVIYLENNDSIVFSELKAKSVVIKADGVTETYKVSKAKIY